MHQHRRIIATALLFPALLALTASDSLAFRLFGEKPTPTPEHVQPAKPSTQKPGHPAIASKKAQTEFLQRIRKNDPEKRTIERAMFNDRNELGLILNRSVPLETIPALMKTLLTQMAAAFPGQDAVILAYAPTKPPMLIGTGKLNIKTRVMTYERAKQQ